MKIIFEKDGERLEYKTATATYVLLSLIPFIGDLVILVMTILRKQFRGIWLNRFIILFGLSLVASLLRSIPGVGAMLALIVYVIYLVASVILTVMYALNANYYSIKERLEEGYTVVNRNEPEVQAAIDRANSIKKPFWQFTQF